MNKGNTATLSLVALKCKQSFFAEASPEPSLFLDHDEITA